MPNISATQIIILGGGGDLSQRKLLPALLDLFTRKKLPETFNIIGLARTPRTDEQYRQFVAEAIEAHCTNHNHTLQNVMDFCEHVSYVQGSFDDIESYHRLNEAISNFDSTNSIACNRLFYLAVPPKHYHQIFSDLKTTGAADESHGSWTHILVEKPFGRDLETAQTLDTQLASLYREDQIFRIDHYLAKEAVQNILSFRFANTLLKVPWNKDSIESVHINMSETIDVGHRANFYEGVGALRDVGQNHILQLLALVAMREPDNFNTDSIREARCEVLQALKEIPTDEFEASVLRGQYEDYQKNDIVADDSQTETYFELKAELDLSEWKGVPFYLSAGKALDKEEVSIVVKFLDICSGMFVTNTCLSVGNKITLTISPEQTIAITFNTKTPGLGFNLESQTLSFTCEKGDLDIKNAYEKVLYDSIIGDQTLFTHTKEVLAAWKFITPIIEEWDKLPLHQYKKGTKGPAKSIIK
ncbi:glucose-6-phosphate dehydrogenase [Candidatus Nomurabacteria bacterium]|nr:glucose-6-phosphate dehydrogenase [Candidatus Nomurabacteria bacterium]